jgi:hypothetical protein
MLSSQPCKKCLELDELAAQGMPSHQTEQLKWEIVKPLVTRMLAYLYNLVNFMIRRLQEVIEKGKETADCHCRVSDANVWK